MNRRRPWGRLRQAGVRAARAGARVATNAPVAVARAPLDFVAGMGQGLWHGAEHYMDIALAEPEPTWRQWLGHQLNPRGMGQNVGILVHEGVPPLAQLTGRLGAGAVRGVGSLAIQGADLVRDVQDQIMDRLMPDTPAPSDMPEERANFARTDAMWQRMSEMQSEFNAEVRPDSMHHWRYRRAFDIVRDSLSRGQAHAAEVQLDALERILGQIVASSREHTQWHRRP